MSKIQQESSSQGKHQHELLERLTEEQDRFGYLSGERLAEIARSLGLTISEVYGVATFYSFLSTKPRGRNVIRICKCLPCFLKQSAIIVDRIEQELGVKAGETTPDGKFSFELTNCIGACDKAPAMMVNHDVYGNLTPEKIPQILEEYR